jgi:hypothetical protein
MKKLIILLLIVSACSSSKDEDPKPINNKFAGAYEFKTPHETVLFVITDNLQGDLDVYNCLIDGVVSAKSSMVDSNMKIQYITITEKVRELTIILEDLSFGANNSLIARHATKTTQNSPVWAADNLVINRIGN